MKKHIPVADGCAYFPFTLFFDNGDKPVRETIAVLSAKLDDDSMMDAMREICVAASARGMDVQFFAPFDDFDSDDLHTKGESSIYERINYSVLSGIILFPERIKNDEFCRGVIEKAHKLSIPVASIDRYFEGCSNISYGYEDAFEKIVRHLVDCHNVRKVFVVAGMRNNSFSDERIDAVRKVLSEKGITLSEDDIGYGDFWDGPARDVIRNYLDSKRELPDAFIAANDVMAITIIAELIAAGYSVPEDVIVTGFDGIEMEKYINPRLTTAEQDMRVGMKCAVSMVCDKDRPKNEHVIIPYATRFSQSCGCIPKTHNYVTLQIKNLYGQITNKKNGSIALCDMQAKMTREKHLNDLVRHSMLFLSFLNTIKDAYIVLTGKYVLFDEKLLTEVEKVNEGFDKKNPGTILLGEYHDNNLTVPLISLKKGELINDYDTQMEKMGGKFVALPLHMQEHVYGYFILGITEEMHDYALVNNFTRMLSSSIDYIIKGQKINRANDKLLKANHELEFLYVHDPMTGMFNRRGFYNEAAKMLKAKCRRFMVVSADLDKLKVINDNFGHAEGDFAIKSIGEALKNSLPENGICARFGGDEFAAFVIVDENDENPEEKWKKAFNREISRINEACNKGYKISASVGAETGNISENTDIDEILKIADDKMYAIKEVHHMIKVFGISLSDRLNQEKDKK